MNNIDPVIIDVDENEEDAFTAGLLNMSAPEADVRHMQGENLDESYNLDFQITVDDLLKVINGPEASVQLKSPIHRWKGGCWSLLVQKNDNLTLGYFLGLTTMSDMKPGYRITLRCGFTVESATSPTFELRTSERNVYDSSGDTYKDFGFRDASISVIWNRVASDSPCFFRCNMTELIDFANYSSKEATGMAGLENLGATCYLNALLQMLYHVNEFRRAVYEIPIGEEKLQSSTTLALQSVFHELQESSGPVTTKDLTMAFGWTTLDSFMQQDVQEMMRVLLDKLEEKMKDTEVKGVIKHLFSGTVKSFIRCVNVEYESSREEDFYDIQLDVKGCADIYESFRRYISKEMLDGENKYDAEVHGKQDAEKGVIFTKFPPVLTIHLKRFDFDIQRMCFAKIHDKIVFPVELKLDEFLDPSSADGTKNEYLLHSVLVHSGDVHGGHYYAFIRPSESKFWSEGECFTNVSGGQWFKFDDETVLKVPPQEAIDKCFGRDVNATTFRSFSSAYMLVYIRKEEATRIMTRVSSESIPLALVERLKAEQDNKKIEEHQKMITEYGTHVNYYLEEDAASFNSFNNKSRDCFLDSENPRKLNILKGWTFYGLYIEFAKLLKVPIYKICLWMIEFNDFDIRIQCSHWDWLQLNRSTLDIGDNRGKYAFYVQIVDTSDLRVGFDQSHLFEIDKTYDSLLKEESLWLHDLRATLDPDANFQFDVAEGLGVGKSTFTLKFRSPSNDIYSTFIGRLETIKDKFNQYLYQIVQYHGENRRLYFIRIFDPDQVLDPSNFHIEHENCPSIYRYIGHLSLNINESEKFKEILFGKFEELCKQPGPFDLFLRSSLMQVCQDSHGKISQFSGDEDTNKNCALICVEFPSTKISFENWFRSEFVKKQFVLVPMAESFARIVSNVSGNSSMVIVVEVSVEFSLLDVFMTVSKSLGIHYSYLKLGLAKAPQNVGKEIKPISGQQLHSVQLKGDIRGYNYITFAIYPVRVHDEINGSRVAGYFVEVNILDQRLRSKHTNSIEGTDTVGEKRRNDSVLPTTKHQKLDEDQLDVLVEDDYESSVCRDMEPYFKDPSKLYLQVNDKCPMSSLAKRIRSLLSLESDRVDRAVDIVEVPECDLDNAASILSDLEADTTMSLQRTPLTSETDSFGNDSLFIFSIVDDKNPICKRGFMYSQCCDELPKIDSIYNSHYSAHVQLISKEDRMYMLNAAVSSKSSFITIASFQMFGTYAKVVKSETEPFLTYVKDDDDIDSLRRRIGMITGEAEEDWSKYRLAFIKNQSESIFLSTDDGNSIWELFESIYPQWNDLIDSIKRSSYLFSDPRNPILGIQRKFSTGGLTRLDICSLRN